MKKQRKIIIIVLVIILILIFAGLTLTLKLTEKGIFKTAQYEGTEDETETTYEIIEKVGTKYKVLIIAKNDLGIQKVKCPNELEIACNNKNKIAIDYEVEESIEYKFIIELSNNKEATFILNMNANDIEIKENTSMAYPIITEYGIEVGKIVKIEYNKPNAKNYYSLDNGNTWIKYENEIKILKEVKIKAKSIVANEMTQIRSKDIKLNLANDAIGSNAYDGNSTTCYEVTEPSGNNRYDTYSKYMNIDSTAQGKKISIRVSYPRINYCTFYFYDVNGNRLSTMLQFPFNNGTSDETKTVTIPENAVKMECSMYVHAMSNTYIRIWKIEMMNEPVINVEEKYAKITNSNFEESYTKATIEYFNTSVEKKYKINDNEWKDYNNEEIRLNIGDTLYAKGIDINGKETRAVSQYTAKLKSDTISKNAYDGNNNTYYEVTESGTQSRYMDIDSTAQGKKISIRVSYRRSNYCTLYFYDMNGNRLSTSLDFPNWSDSTYSKDETKTVTIPENAVKMECSMNVHRMSNTYIRIWEMKIID